MWTKGLDFPTDPAIGDIHLDIDSGVLWVYNGSQWIVSVEPARREIPLDLIIHDLQLMRSELE